MERNDRNRPEEPGRVEFPAAELRAAAVVGLGSIEDGAVAEQFLADPRADGDALAVRALAALLLAEALKRCFNEPEVRTELDVAAMQALRRRADREELDEAVGEAFKSLSATVDAYERGSGRFAAPTGELFPVRSVFLSWVKTRVWRHALAGRFRGVRNRPPLGPGPEGPPHPLEQISLPPAVAAALQASTEEDASTSPDFAARTHQGAALTHQHRVAATISQVLARSRGREAFLDPAAPTDSIRRAVRAAMPQARDAAVNDLVRTLAPDVCHGVLPVLRVWRSNLARASGGDVESDLVDFLETLIVVWEAELLGRVVGLVSDALFEAVAPARIKARCQWLQELWTAYKSADGRVHLRCELLRPIPERLRTARLATRSPYAEATDRWPDEAAQTVIAITVSMEAWLAEAGGQA